MQAEFRWGARCEGSACSRHKCEDNNKIDLQAGGWGSTDWVDMAQDRDRSQAVVNVVMNHQVP